MDLEEEMNDDVLAVPEENANIDESKLLGDDLMLKKMVEKFIPQEETGVVENTEFIPMYYNKQQITDSDIEY